ncbi:hypothetical protein OS493_027495 [Desmophyllum pertusum]|uniref:Uncharacterized protein n=1 Tax=Desmophyllum pertusum TaxID=174260 RepID=A0A9X0CD25_9CNID|nr:hypothetical protein OS493_027495 [Desmophyllum pertusum]
MKFALVLGLCLAFAFVVESFEEDEEFLEDEYKNDKRFLFKRCNTDGDCGSGECCFKNLLYNRCKTKLTEGSLLFCNPRSACYFRCQDGLECRRVGSGFLSHYKCKRPIAPPPTEEPGSGDVDNF